MSKNLTKKSDSGKVFTLSSDMGTFVLLTIKVCRPMVISRTMAAMLLLTISFFIGT